MRVMGSKREGNNQVGAKMGKSTQPVYWGRAVITGHVGWFPGYARPTEPQSF